MAGGMVVQIDDRVQVELMVNSAYGIAAFRSSHRAKRLRLTLPTGYPAGTMIRPPAFTGIPSEVI